jgi:hypothetical protein
VRATKPGLIQPSQGRRPRSPSFSSSHHALSLAEAVMRGEPRSVHSPRPRCRFLPLARVYPTAMSQRAPHLRGFRPRSIVRIDVHGSKDRAKDASRARMRRSLVPAAGACALWRMLTAFPSSAPFGHPLSSARHPPREDTRCGRRTDLGPRSDDAPRRAPPSRRPGCLRPSRHVEDFGVCREGIAPSGLHAGSPAHAAHTFSRSHEGTVFLIGPCKVTERSPAGP